MTHFFSSDTHFFERGGVPYAQTTTSSGDHAVLNCAFDPPEKVDSFQRLQDWEEIPREIFDRLRKAHLAAQDTFETEHHAPLHRAAE